ncbi:unnamed protein product [Larinioides sclopetarius]|uniref:Uncharacterized protein n=1 Tax=Larinioides sclopetarius TaxID=280406 RepID=A0AAV2B7U3_9ARAC
MKLVLAIIFVLCIVGIDAKPKRDRNGRARNEEGEDTGNDDSRKPPNHKGYKSKYPFPLFKSCLDFNVEYASRRKELKRNKEIWVGKCKTGEETEQEMCKSQGISSIRCSLANGPSEECIKEINDFLNGISCDEADGGETEDNVDNGSATEGADVDFEEDFEEENIEIDEETE